MNEIKQLKQKVESKEYKMNKNYQLKREKRVLVKNEDDDDDDHYNDYIYVGSYVNDNNDDDGNVDDYEKRMKSNVKQTIANSNNMLANMYSNSYNNNNNCHLKNIKLYLNKTTAIAKKYIAKATINSTFSRTLYSNISNSNQQTTAHSFKPAEFVIPNKSINANTNNNITTITTLDTLTNSITCSSTPSTCSSPATSQQQQQQYQPINVENVAALAIGAVANVANNLNKFYCNFTTSFTTTTTISIKWILMFLMLFNILAQTPHQVAAEKSKHCK